MKLLYQKIICGFFDTDTDDMENKSNRVTP